MQWGWLFFYKEKRIRVRETSHTTFEQTIQGRCRMGRTKQGNANANRNNNKKLGNRTSEELVEFTTGEKAGRQPDIKEKNIGK